MTKQKSKFWTYVFALIPGCGQMYLGFMKRGLSLQTVFLALCILPNFFSLYSFELFALVVWCYGFFDAINLNNCTEEAFAKANDNYIVESKSFATLNLNLNKNLYGWIGSALIVFGICFIFNSIFDYFYYNYYDSHQYLLNAIYQFGNYVPNVIISIVLVIVGIKLIKRKKNEIITQENDTEIIEVGNEK